jgi:hypothetical protein
MSKRKSLKLGNKKELVGEPYKLTVKSLGRVFKSEGSTLEEALGKIKIGNGAKAMCVLTVERGDQRKERIINAHYAHKLFSEVGLTMKMFALKQVNALVGL